MKNPPDWHVKHSATVLFLFSTETNLSLFMLFIVSRESADVSDGTGSISFIFHRPVSFPLMCLICRHLYITWSQVNLQLISLLCKFWYLCLTSQKIQSVLRNIWDFCLRCFWNEEHSPWMCISACIELKSIQSGLLLARLWMKLIQGHSMSHIAESPLTTATQSLFTSWLAN